jgi:hypothetical protein
MPKAGGYTPGGALRGSMTNNENVAPASKAGELVTV